MIDRPLAAVDEDSDEAPEASRAKKEAKNLRGTRMFLVEEADLFDELLILQACLLPQTMLMKALLTLNSPHQDFESNEAVCDGAAIRPSRLLQLQLAATNCEGIFGQCMSRMTVGLLEPGRWLHIPQTERYSSCLIRHALRPAAVLTDWLLQPLSMWPFKLLRSTDLEALRVVMAEAQRQPCVVDEFSKSMLSQVEHGSISEEELVVVLATTTLHMMGNTFAVEQMHSCNAGGAKRRVQARAMEVSDLAMWLQSHNAFPWFAHSPASAVFLSVHPPTLSSGSCC